MAERAAIDRSKLAVSSLTSADSGDLAAFSSGDHDIDDFLKSDALRLERLHVARTYLAWYGSSPELVGYVSLMADAIVLQNRERKKLKLASDDHPVVPAIKVVGCSRSTPTRIPCPSTRSWASCSTGRLTTAIGAIRACGSTCSRSRNHRGWGRFSTRTKHEPPRLCEGFGEWVTGDSNPEPPD